MLRRALPALVCAALLAGCGALTPGGVPPRAAASAAGSSASSATTAAAPTVVVENTSLGPVLADGTGLTLYVNTQDGNDSSTCTGSCTALWVPLPASGTPVAGPGVEGTLAAFRRADGTEQLAMNGHPLYLYAKDTAPGQTGGQGLDGVWFAASPNGTPVGGAAAAAATVRVVQNPTYGPILADAAGNTLYLYTQDAPNFSRCTGSCATLWPPLTVPAGTTPTAGAGVTGHLGTFRRPDGTEQVTINGQPLYTYSQDRQPGQATGQGFENQWFVVEPSGAEHA